EPRLTLCVRTRPGLRPESERAICRIHGRVSRTDCIRQTRLLAVGGLYCDAIVTSQLMLLTFRKVGWRRVDAARMEAVHRRVGGGSTKLVAARPHRNLPPRRRRDTRPFS